MKLAYIYLTCSTEAEADKIAAKLLNKKLIACAKTIKTNSAFWWQGKVKSSDEFLLVMESARENFDQIEEVVSKIHTYKTFVLSAVLVERVSAKAKEWWEESLE